MLKRQLKVEEYMIREILERAAAHLDPSGPYTEEDQQMMATYIRYFLKNDEHYHGSYLRPHLRDFAEKLESTLQHNQFKGDWREYSFREILEMLADEVDEVDLSLELRDRELCRLELQDVATLCMMAWYKSKELPVVEEGITCSSD